MTGRIPLIVLALVILAGNRQAQSESISGGNGFALVDQMGGIRKPTDFRDRYQALGTFTVLDPKGDQMHVTYASPGTAEYYRKIGKFADGTVLVKEILGT